MTWTTIASTRRDVDSPAEEDLFTDFYNRDENLREAPFCLLFAEVSTASAWPTYATVLTSAVYIPAWASGITLAAQFKVTGSFALFQWFLDGTSVAAADSTTSATYDDSKRKTLAAIDEAIRGSVVDITLNLAQVGGTAYAIQTDGPACRFIE